MEPAFEYSLKLSTAGETDLELNDHVAFEVVVPPRVGQEWRTEFEEGPFQEGAAQTGRIKGQVTGSFRVRVLGSDWVTQAANAATLMQAFEQWLFTMTETKADVVTTFPRVSVEAALPRGATDESYEVNNTAYRIEEGVEEYVVTFRCDPTTQTLPEEEPEP